MHRTCTQFLLWYWVSLSLLQHDEECNAYFPSLRSCAKLSLYYPFYTGPELFHHTYAVIRVTLQRVDQWLESPIIMLVLDFR